MSKLFIDNLGKVSIYDKYEVIPGSLRVRMKTGPSADMLKINNEISVFISSVSNVRESKFALKQNLLTEYYLIPFGEGPANLTVSGIVFATSQVNTNKSGLTSYSRLMELPPELNTPNQDPSSNTPAWVTAGAEAVSGAVKSVAGALSGITKLVSEAITKVTSVVNAITSLPSTIVNAIKSGLGMSAEESLTPTALGAPEYTPLSFQQLHRVFDLIHAGATKKGAPSAVEVSIAYGGVVFSGYLTGLKTDPIKGGMGYMFSMTFICTTPPTYETEYVDPTVRTRGTVSGQIFDAALEYGVSALRPVGGGSSFNVGRLVA